MSERRPQAGGTCPETELLLCCARARLGSGGAGRISDLLREELDWERLIQTALRHGMMPLLYRSLATACPEAVPKAILDQLRDHFHNNARRNLFLTGELLKCLELLAEHGIAAVPFRGPVLAASAYGDLALRQFDDLDILLHQQDVLRARDLLVSQGFCPEFQLTRAQEAAYLRDQSEHKVLRDGGMLIIELHWRFAERYFCFPLDTEPLWQRLEPASLAGREVRTLSAEDVMLILCVHGAKHLWDRLVWVCDVAAWIGVHGEMDWEWVMEQAAALGSKRMLFLGLCLASELLGAALPEDVWPKVQADRAAAWLAAQVRDQLFDDAQRQPGDLDWCLFHLRARERLEDRVRYCVRLAVTTTPGDWASVRLPSSLFPVYYVLRPIRLVGSYGLRLLKRFLSRPSLRGQSRYVPDHSLHDSIPSVVGRSAATKQSPPNTVTRAHQ